MDSMRVMRGSPGEEAVHLAAELVRQDTAERQEGVLAELLQPRLETAGLGVRRHEFAPGRAGLVATGRTPPGLVFTGHLDTVAASSADWSWDPWSGGVIDGLLRGRGSSDMKGGVAAIVAAAESLAREGRLPEDVAVVLTAGEETGCEGARAMTKAGLLGPLSDRNSPPDLVVAEPTDLVPVRGHKGVVWLEVTTTGVSAHGSSPQLGRNAVTSLAEGVTRLETVDTGLVHPVFGSVTWNVGTFHGGTRPNVVPDRASAEVDVRTVPGVGSDEVRARARDLFGPDAEIAVTFESDPVLTDESDPLIERAVALFPGSEQPEPTVASFFTDASVLADALGGSSVLVLGPGAPGQAHAIDESCAVTKIERAVEIFAALAVERGRM